MTGLAIYRRKEHNAVQRTLQVLVKLLTRNLLRELPSLALSRIWSVGEVQDMKYRVAGLSRYRLSKQPSFG